MSWIRRITGLMLFAFYALVLLHNAIPHSHGNSANHNGIVSNDHTHSPCHSHDHRHDSSESHGLLHALGHIFGHGQHSHQDEDHLVPGVTSIAPNQFKISFNCAYLPQAVDLVELNITTHSWLDYRPPPGFNSQICSTNSLRGPPILG